MIFGSCICPQIYAVELLSAYQCFPLNAVVYQYSGIAKINLLLEASPNRADGSSFISFI